MKHGDKTPELNPSSFNGATGERPVELPYWKFWPADFNSSPAVKMLNFVERGAYHQLLAAAWQYGVIPDSDAAIARAIDFRGARIPASIRTVLLQFFTLVPLQKCTAVLKHTSATQKGWINARIERDYAAELERHKSKQQAQIKSVEARRRNRENGLQGNLPLTAHRSDEERDESLSSSATENAEPSSLETGTPSVMERLCDEFGFVASPKTAMLAEHWGWTHEDLDAWAAWRPPGGCRDLGPFRRTCMTNDGRPRSVEPVAAGGLTEADYERAARATGWVPEEDDANALDHY